MSATTKTEIKLERTIAGNPEEVFAAWLDPKVPGTPWHENSNLIFDPKVNGLWYWLSVKGTPHYGRFTEIDRSKKVQHSWMSKFTLGEESMVTVTFEKKGEGTLMTLVHSGLPNEEMARAHENGWRPIFDKFGALFVDGAARKS